VNGVDALAGAALLLLCVLGLLIRRWVAGLNKK